MTIYGLFIGIDHYQDPRVPTLRYSVNDARTLQQMFANSIVCRTSLLIDTLATARRIRQSVVNIANEAKEEDSVILYFAGHGAMEEIEEKGGKMDSNTYLVPFDADRDDLESTALSMDIDIARFFRRLKARNVILFVDSCYSGEAGGRTFPVKGVTYRREPSLLLESLNLITGKGRLIVTAAKSNELAHEDAAVQHGIFTHFLIEALKGACERSSEAHVTFSEIFRHIEQKVSQWAHKTVGRSQHPFYRGEVEEEVKLPVLAGLGYKTLLDFPYAFTPLVVVVGDKRESTPKTAGDLFAYSASPADLSKILNLNLPRDTEIVSDKVFVNSEKEYLLRRFGKQNLLVIGSPASNLLARRINSTAIFRFAIENRTMRYVDSIHERIQEIKNQPAKLQEFASDTSNRESLSHWMNHLRKAGFLDPTKRFATTGFVTPEDRDYGVITLCRNPYTLDGEAKTVSILVAGVHLPGTLQAMSLLSKPSEAFKSHPLGGIIAVNLLSPEWGDRVMQALPEWSTESYDNPAALIAHFLNLKSRSEEIPLEMTDEVVDDCIEFIKELSVLKADAVNSNTYLSE